MITAAKWRYFTDILISYHSEIVVKATFASLISVFIAASSPERNEATFIFLACSRIDLSCANTVLRMW